MRECAVYHHLQVSPVAGALGAQVQGVDLARALAPDVVGEIRRALLAHLVIFFPRQQLGPPELLAFAERFGQPTEYPHMKGLPGYPHVMAVTKLEREKVNFGGSGTPTPPTWNVRRWAPCSTPSRSSVRRRHALRQPVPGL